MKYTGRIVITTVILALVAIARIYGNLFYNFPVLKLPSLGIIAILICWWLGKKYDEVKFYSEKDILTELHNRRYVARKFPKLLIQMGKENKKITLFLIDVDKFKHINDTHGHEMGDKVLQYISKVLLSNTTKKDIVARWAGDEFLIISPNSKEHIGDVIIKQIKNDLKKLSYDIHIDVSVSIGASIYPNDASTLDALLNYADREMYEMKCYKSI